MPKKRKYRIQKELAPVLHIYCEGEKTEPNYFNGYIANKLPGNRRLKIVRVEKTNKNTPGQLIEEAVEAKNDKNCPEGDEFWVVYDRESEAKCSVDLHHGAYQCAKRYSINIALSNVCIEIWILLHFQNNTAPYSSYNDLKQNSELCKNHLKTYDKSNNNIFNLLEDKVSYARINAIAMNTHTQNSADPSWTKPYQLNPYTDVYKLLDAIDLFGKN